MAGLIPDSLAGWYYSNSPLTEKQMQSNALLVKEYFTNRVVKAWDGAAIAGMLGNMQAESTVNPGRWENGDKNNLEVGYGLVQWTPASKYINWAGNTFASGNTQCRRIEWERENEQQFASLSVLPKFVNDDLGIPRVWRSGLSSGPVDIPGISGFNNFAYGTNWPHIIYPGINVDLSGNVRYAAWCFLLQYERPGETDQPWRADFAEAWAEFLGLAHKLRISPVLMKHITAKRKLLKNRKEWGNIGLR